MDSKIPEVQSQDDNKIESQTSTIRDVDDALKFLQTEAEAGEADAVDDKALVRKIDWMIVPLMFCCYFLQYLDKSLLNYASVMGLLDDTGINTNQYATLAWLFYLGFLIFEIPHAYLMQRLPTAKYLGTMVFCWGIVVTCTSACKTYSSLAALRFLLGVFESAISPSLILISSMWFRREEQPRRIGFWYIGVGTATIAGSLISFGFQHYHSKVFYSWQIMFLCVGLVTITVGVIVFFLLPDNPMSSRLTHAEKVATVERLRENQTGVENKHFKLYQVRQCLTDPQTWFLSAITIAASIPNGAVSSFQSIVIKGIGFTNQESALLQIPSGVIAVASVLIATYIAGKYNARGVMIITMSAIGGILGGGLLAFLPQSNTAGKLAGNYVTQVVGSFLPCSYSLAAANQAGHTKKVTMNAILLISFCLGNILGPLSFQDKDKPLYTPAKITIVAVDSTAILLTISLLLWYKFQNTTRDRAAKEAGVVHRQDVEFADLTDRENKEFRYKF